MNTILDSNQSGIPIEVLIRDFHGHIEPLSGDFKQKIYGPCSQERPVKGAIAFVSEPLHLVALLKSEVGAVVVHTKQIELAKQNNPLNKPILASENPYLCMAKVNAKYFSLPFLKSTFDGERIHPSATVSASAKIADDVILAPGVVISADVVIGAATFIGANSVIEPNSTIGANCFIHPSVYIGHSCQIGDYVEIMPNSTIGTDGYGYAHNKKNEHFRIPHYGAVIIEDDVHIGANVNIDRGTYEPAIIGKGTKIDNHCHFGHNVKIGKNCLITAGMITAGSVTIGDNCIFGGRSSVNGHISICAGCTFAGLTGVNRSIDKPGVYGGFPVIPMKDSLKVLSSTTQLPKMRKQLAKIMARLGIGSENTDSNTDT